MRIVVVTERVPSVYSFSGFLFSVYGNILISALGRIWDTMGFKVLCFGLLFVSFLSYIYTPMPDNIEETWKVMALDAVAKTCNLVVRIK